MANDKYEWENLVKAKPDSGTPTQENVDQSFKFLVDIQIYLDSIHDEIESFHFASYKERFDKITEISDKINNEITPKLREKGEEEAGAENPILKKLKERLRPNRKTNRTPF